MALGFNFGSGGGSADDIIPIVKPVTKFAVTLNDPQDVRRVLDEALWHMLDDRPGPVWIDIPLDVQAAQIDPAKLSGWSAPAANKGAEKDWTKSFAELLGQATRPLILAGHGINIAGAKDEFRQFAEKQNIPCVFTWNAADQIGRAHV